MAYLILAALVLFCLALVAMFVVLVGHVRGWHRAYPWSAPCILKYESPRRPATPSCGCDGAARRCECVRHLKSCRILPYTVALTCLMDHQGGILRLVHY